MLNNLKNINKPLLRFSAFLLVLAIYIPRAHALVVEPFIALGILQALVYIIGIIVGLVAIPLTYVIKVFTKWHLKKVLLVVFLVLALIAGTLFIFAKVALNSKKVTGTSKTNQYVMPLKETSKPTQQRINGEMAPAYRPVVDTNNDTNTEASPNSYVVQSPMPTLRRGLLPNASQILIAFGLFNLMVFVPTLLGLVTINYFYTSSGKEKLLKGTSVIFVALSISSIVALFTVFILLVRYLV